MNIITSAGSAAAAVATQVRGERRAANIVTRPGTLTVWGGGNWGRQGRWRGYTGTLNRGWDLSGHVNSALGILSQIIQTILSVFNGTVGYIVHMRWRGSGAGDW